MAKLVPSLSSEQIVLSGDIAVGIGFPLNVGTPKQNFTTTQQIHDNLRNLILTMKGERPMQPTFGSDLYNLLFEPLYEDTLTMACSEAIKSAVAQWMPFVTIEDVDVTERRDKNLMLVRVSYSVQGWTPDNTLNLAVKV